MKRAGLPLQPISYFFSTPQFQFCEKVHPTLVTSWPQTNQCFRMAMLVTLFLVLINIFNSVR